VREIKLPNEKAQPPGEAGIIAASTPNSGPRTASIDGNRQRIPTRLVPSQTVAQPGQTFWACPVPHCIKAGGLIERKLPLHQDL